MTPSARTRLWLVLGLALWALAACRAQPSGEVADTGLPNLATASTRGVNNAGRAPQAGELAPDFVLTFADGARQKLSDWQGQPVVLNFWATWCSPCKEEMPTFVKTYGARSQDGLVIVGINAEESAGQAAAFMQSYQMTFPVALDEQGEIQQLYGVRGLPTTFFIDREGRIAQAWTGLLLAPMLDELLAEID